MSYRDEEKLELFQNKEITIPFIQKTYTNTMKTKALHYTIYFIAFITLFAIEGTVLSLVFPSVSETLNVSELMSVLTGVVFLLINYGILYRYYKYADLQIRTVEQTDRETEAQVFRDVMTEKGYTVTRFNSFKDASSAIYTDSNGVAYRTVAGNYNGKELNLFLVSA